SGQHAQGYADSREQEHGGDGRLDQVNDVHARMILKSIRGPPRSGLGFSMGWRKVGQVRDAAGRGTLQMNAARIRFALSVIALGAVAGTACGQAGDDPSPCASITDDKSRLQCYDAQEATRMRRRGAATASSVPVAPLAPPVVGPL